MSGLPSRSSCSQRARGSSAVRRRVRDGFDWQLPPDPRLIVSVKRCPGTSARTTTGGQRIRALKIGILGVERTQFIEDLP
jgi:hypothetical protein